MSFSPLTEMYLFLSYDPIKRKLEDEIGFSAAVIDSWLIRDWLHRKASTGHRLHRKKDNLVVGI